MSAIKVESITVRASNGRAIQAPASIWLSAIINLMTPQQTDKLFQHVEGRMSPLILRPAPLNGGRMILKKPLEV